MKRALVLAGLAGGWLCLLAPAASAHPLGNFTVNTADRVIVAADTVRVQHIVDNAEIPTLQLSQASDGPDADRDGTLSETELAAWSATRCAALAPQLRLVLDGRRAPLSVAESAARRVTGQAGLPTLRLDCTFDARRAVADRVELDDPTSAGRTGWKEVSATALCGRLTGTGGVPDTSPSNLLTAYPQDLLSSPLDVTHAAFGVTSGGGCRADSGIPAPSQVLPRGVDRFTSSYTSFVGRQHLTWPVAIAAVLLSIVLGCGHAVAPGHGKTVIAAYLVGQRGTRRQAVWLGATVTATHTAGVLLLGAALSLTSIATPERFVPGTEVASGLLLGGVGVYLLRRALRARTARTGGATHAHDVPDHAHDGPEHAHDGPEHAHDGHAHDGHAHPHDGHEHPHDGHEHPHDGHEHPHEHGAGHGDDTGHGHGHGHPHDPAPEHDGHDHPSQRLIPVGVGGGAGSVALTARTPAPTPGAVLQAPGTHTHGGRTHSHAPIEDAPIGWRTLATMGIAGGLVPSPSALVVLLGASALGRPVFGALLVVGYGVGMALTLTVAGLLLLRAQAVLQRRGWTGGRGAQTLRLLPALTAAVVLVVGTAVVVRGILTFRGLG